MPSSQFWGVSWDSSKGKWQACYTARDGRTIKIGRFDDEEAAALAVNKATRDAGLEGERNMNAIDAAGKPLPKPPGRFNPTPKKDKSGGRICLKMRFVEVIARKRQDLLTVRQEHFARAYP